ncbi:MAG: hypothetical protein Q7O12_01695 [Deltaproteobacteria bacterium]|nr:hypothetical protein [Deltaproteobacteria bacterium]
MGAKTGVVVAIILILISNGCDNRRSKDEYKFIEYIEVEGNCYEDHVKQSANYKGDIVHWYNITKNIHSIYGSVSTFDVISGNEMIKNIIERNNDPYKYYPPDIIELSDLSKEDIGNDVLNIKGISRHSGKDMNSVGPRYKATCNLKVTCRLNYLPSLKKEGNKSR